MSGLRFDWDQASRPTWDGLLARASRPGLQQGWAYGEALAAGGVAVQRLVVRDAAGRPLAVAQAARRRILGALAVGFLLRGPIWLPDAAEPPLEAAVLAEVRARLGARLLVWAPDVPPAPPRRRPILTGYSTGWLPIGDGLASVRRRLRGKWRHQLVRAEAAAVALTRETPGTGLAWLLAGNEAHRRAIGYRGPAPAFLSRLAAAAAGGEDLFCLLAWERREPVAGIMVVRHGDAATYEVGYADPRGRALKATYRLLWRAVELLHAAGVRALDLGGLDTDRAPGVAGFKLGLAPDIVTQPGTFLVTSK